MDTIKIDKNKTLMIAHRGLSKIERENTASAFIAAGNRTYYGCECDVRKTLDNKYVIAHDADLKRNAGKALDIKDCTYEELLKVNLFDVLGIERDYYKILLLEDYIRICKKYQKKCIIEFKIDFSEFEIKEIVEKIKKEEYVEECIFISFFKKPLLITKGLLSNNKIQFLNDKIDEDTFNFCVNNHFGIDVQHKALSKEVVEMFHKENLEVNCWTVDDPKRAKELIEMGVDYITTNILE